MASENSWGDLFGAAGPFGLYYGAKGLGAAGRLAPKLIGSPWAMGGAPGLAAATMAGVMEPTPANAGERDIYIRDRSGRMVLNPNFASGAGRDPSLLSQPNQAPDTSNLSSDEAQRGMPLNALPQPPQGGAVGAPSAAPSPSPQPGGALPSSLVFGGPDAGATGGGFRAPGASAPQSATAPAPAPRPVPQQVAQAPQGRGGFQSPQGNPYYNGPGSMSFGAGDPGSGGSQYQENPNWVKDYNSPGGGGYASDQTSKHQGLLSKFLAGLTGQNHNGLFSLFNGPNPQFASGASRVGSPNYSAWQNPDRTQMAGVTPSMFSFPRMPTDI